MNRRQKLSITFKLFYWTFVIFALGYPFKSITNNLYEKFRDNSLSFTIDSAYLDFNTSFPSISVCQVFNGEKNWDLSERYFGGDRDTRIDDFLTEISFFTGACYTCELCSVEIDCPKNYSDILEKFRSNCTDLIKNCSWNGEAFECCEGFRPLATETGMCYTINSALTVPKYGRELFCNRENGPGTLKMMVSEDVQIYIHHQNDIPFAYSERDLKDTILWGSTKQLMIKVTEITNDETVPIVPIKQRRCKFSWENEPSSVYDLYSFSTCQTSCYNKAQIDFCNCTHHLMPRNPRLDIPQCDFKGLLCLTENFMKISEIRKACSSCISSCEEHEYRIIYNSNEEMGNEEGTDITVSMISLPTHRYFRRTVKTMVDFVISIGGVLGLFFGFSFISVLDVAYKGYFVIKRIFKSKDK
ncbi:CLUMA_CG000653, isoform A [Clunio marinus]|uniref:CLUMA_CG000653, isoform A n=1 Tax=Clunio marinus TaxID=568069 RepID=A0A1J1HFQ2_9DIPT|nr:CLUMA_CG000653, isoform A [Clunio marinus]